jgi:hypothetical protein
VPPKDLETALSLRRTKEIELFPKVNTFLHSIARNSIKSKRSYSSGLTLLQNFLNKKEKSIIMTTTRVILPLVGNAFITIFSKK